MFTYKQKWVARTLFIALLMTALAIFTITPAAAQQPENTTPGTIGQSGPTGTVSINPIVNFTWPRDGNATWYNLAVVNSSTGSIIHDLWLPQEQTCVASLCTFDDVLLTNGSYAWYMRGWGVGGMGPWNNGQSFALSFTDPAVVPLDMPHTYVNGMVNVRWSRDLNASWYEVYVAGPDGYVYHEWHAADANCWYNRCYAPQELTPGDYDVWLRGWGPGGLGAWNTAEYEFIVY